VSGGTEQRVHARNLVEWARGRPEAVVLSGDLTTSCEVDTFRDAYPGRFFSMGLSEQNMIGFAAGMAREGYFPMVHTFAVFMYRRALDQIEMSLAYPRLPVAMFGFLPGVTTPGGVTHQAIDDIGVLRAVPNLTILECGDATEVESVLDVAHGVAGPVYVRMIRGEIPRLFDAAQPMRLGVSRLLSNGTDVALLSTGICTEEALRAAAALQSRGVSLQHHHVSTLKPFSDPAILKSLTSATRGVITMENHSVIGGLGSAVAEMIAAAGLPRKLIRIGINDTYLHGGSRPSLMREHRLDAKELVGMVETLLGQSMNISDEELSAVRLSTFHAVGQQEAL
jgi:transketolase